MKHDDLLRRFESEKHSGCNRFLDRKCTMRSCYIANGWDGKTVPIPVEAKCLDFQMAAAIRELQEALEPFAKIQLSSAFSDTDNEHYWTVLGAPNRSHFTRQDILRARAALNLPASEKVQ
ncbi:MAG TPA: hypothetical protein PLO16_15725 [Acidocella sp.]|nr:hypothetical protein [Acidocella sp.]